MTKPQWAASPAWIRIASGSGGIAWWYGADGESVEVAPQKAVPMSAGLKVNIGGTVVEILA